MAWEVFRAVSEGRGREGGGGSTARDMKPTLGGKDLSKIGEHVKMLDNVTRGCGVRCYSAIAT